MKKINKVLAIILSIEIVLGMTGSTVTFAATDPGLGAATTFSVIAQTAITGTGTISGNVGMNSTGAGITALTAGMVGDTIYSTDGVAPSFGILAPAVQANLSTANDNVSGQSSTASIGPVLDGLILTTGAYDIGAGRLNGGVLTLDGPGIYILRASSDLVSSGSINLINGARACDVYWQVNTLATINGNSFVGTIIAGADIHFGADVILDGRALALGGDVTLLNNTISGPTCAVPPPPTPATLHIIKHVVNDDGGTAVAGDFTLNVTGINVSDPSFVGSETGTDVTLDAGSYTITELVVPAGYLQTGSGDCSGTIASGETKNCTITNDDIAPQLIVNKIVVNDNNGTKVISDFPLFIDGAPVVSGVVSTSTLGLHTVSESTDSSYVSVIGGNCATDGTITLALGDVKTCTITNDDIVPVIPSSSSSGGGSYYPPIPPLIDVIKVPSPLALPNGSGLVTYTYTLRNIGKVPVTNITMVGDTCGPIVRVFGDTNNDSKLDISEVWVHTCSTTLLKTHTNIVTTIGWANGISAIDIANATVVVGIPVVAPFIHVTKIPNPFVLSVGGGMVTYINKVSNLGTVPLSNIRLIDDKCAPVEYVSGDTNGNSKLDITETWTYICRAKLTKTTVNTITAEGIVNGLTVKDFAIATVVVATLPKLPSTGLPFDDNNIPWNIIIPSGIFVIWFCLHFFVRKKLFSSI